MQAARAFTPANGRARMSVAARATTKVAPARVRGGLGPAGQDGWAGHAALSPSVRCAVAYHVRRAALQSTPLAC
jgi:hypothetical protein